MAEPNKLRVTRTGDSMEVLVSDAQGRVHNITEKFREITGTTTPSGFQNIVKAQDNGTSIAIEFTAIDKELNYTLPDTAIQQLVALE